MPRPIDTVVLQRFVEKKRFLKKINKQGVLMRLEIQQKIQILTSRSGYYFTLLKTAICNIYSKIENIVLMFQDSKEILLK